MCGVLVRSRTTKEVTCCLLLLAHRVPPRFSNIIYHCISRESLDRGAGIHIESAQRGAFGQLGGMVEGPWVLLVHSEIVPGAWCRLDIFECRLLISSQVHIVKSEGLRRFIILVVLIGCRCFLGSLRLYTTRIQVDNQITQEWCLPFSQSVNYLALD